MGHPPPSLRRSRRSLIGLAAALAILIGCAAAAQARTYFQPPTFRLGDRLEQYRIERASGTIVLRWQDRCYDRDELCFEGRATHRDRLRSTHAGGMFIIRRKPSFRTGSGALVYEPTQTTKIHKLAVGGGECTDTVKETYGGDDDKVTYSVRIVGPRVRLEMESRMRLPDACTSIDSAPPADALLRSNAVNVAATFSFPLSRLRARRVTLDLRDTVRPFALSTRSGTMLARLRITLTPVRG